MTYISKDPVPVIASAAISLIFIAGYEYQIAHPATEDSKKDKPHNGFVKIPKDAEVVLMPIQGAIWAA